MSIFFVVSCAVQALSGFAVDRFGPRPVLFLGLGLLGLAAFGFAASQSYWMLAAFSVLAGIGNGVFHPVDYTLLNRKVSPARLGHAFSVHGITGSLGWALATGDAGAADARVLVACGARVRRRARIRRAAGAVAESREVVARTRLAEEGRCERAMRRSRAVSTS